MGVFYESIPKSQIEWINQQKMFFVATAPLSAMVSSLILRFSDLPCDFIVKEGSRPSLSIILYHDDTNK